MTLARDPKTGKLYEQKGGEWYEVAPAREAAEELGPLESIGAAAGAELTGLARGAKMRAGQVLGSPSMYYEGAQPQWEEEGAQGELAAAHPLANLAGRALPYLAVPAGGASLPASVGVGAGLGALAPVEDPASSIYLGAGLGAGGAISAGLARSYLGAPGSRAARVRERIQAAAREAQPAPAPAGAARGLEDLDNMAGAQDVALASSQPPQAGAIAELGYNPALLGGRAIEGVENPAHAWAVETADRLKFQLTPGQRFGQQQLLQLEASGRSTPWASAPFTAIQSKNQARFNQIFLDAIGQPGGSVVTVDKLRAAEEGIGGAFSDAVKRIRQSKTGAIDGDAFATDISKIQDEAHAWGYKDFPTVAIFKNRLDNGNFDPLGMLNTRQRLAGMVRDKYANNLGNEARILEETVAAVDDAFERALPGKKDELVRAREIYRLLKLADRPGVWKEEQNIAAGPLYRAMRTGYRRQLRGLDEPSSGSQGVKDLVDAVRMREAAMRDVVSDSGTATRMSLQSLVNNPLKTLAEQSLGRGAALAYIGGGRMLGGGKGKALQDVAGEQLSGIWGGAWQGSVK